MASIETRVIALEREVDTLSGIAWRCRGAMEMQDVVVIEILRSLARNPQVKAAMQATLDQQMQAFRGTDRRDLGLADQVARMADEAISRLDAYRKAIE
ncbi:hypothetical protein [Dyella subtropica]|uniref:hypothetical protein n=1 Tax=Dyella subtropica TaxID=2992127 RepID=UPI0022551610|nr:hypothetical protein [Dyella subtropica]